MPLPRQPVLRETGAHRSRVGEVELFYDLVFVFAITQLSHSLLEHLTPIDALRTGLLFLGVWWMWIYTAWTTNWLNPASAPVRLLLFAMMLLGLVMSSSLPAAFADKGLLFALAYVAQHLLRTGYVIRAFVPRTPRGMNFVRILLWLSVSGACWIMGGWPIRRRGCCGGRPRSASSTWARSASSASPDSARPRPANGTSTRTTWPSAAGCS